MENKKCCKKYGRKAQMICHECVLCFYVGNGDYICENDPTAVVIEEWEPTEEFMRCKGKEFVEL